MNSSKYNSGLACLSGFLLLLTQPAAAQTFDLATVAPNATPAGYTLEWHNALPAAAANRVQADTAVQPGLYYALYYTGSCFSQPAPFRLAIADCGTGMTDLYRYVDSTDKPAGARVSFHTAKPVSAATLYSGNAYAAPAGVYYVAYYNTAQDCYTLGAPIRIIPNLVCGVQPDFNVTHINTPVSGNLNTNDRVPAGTTYSNPIASGSNPGPGVPTLNADGSYQFTPTAPGTYTFTIMICTPDTAVSCVKGKLSITATNPFDPAAPPVVNPDVALADSGKMVTIPVLANDQPFIGGRFGAPTVSNPPHGTAVVDPDGKITYTPAPGFVGSDSFSYTVCDTTRTPAVCKSSSVSVQVQSPASGNSILVNDDFLQFAMNNIGSGNVLTNDIDPDGAPIRATPQSVTIPGAGLFIIDSLGNYTFTPLPNFFGPVQLPYTACDTAGHCAMGTLHALVNPANSLVADFNVAHKNEPATGNLTTNDHLTPGSSFGTPVAAAGNPGSDLPLVNSDGTYSFTTATPGVYRFNIPVCASQQPTPCPTESLTFTITDPVSPVFPPVVNPDQATVKANTPTTINVTENDAATSPGGSLGAPTIAAAPMHGTATLNPDGGIRYTPEPGYSGTDLFYYSICDTVPTPDACKTMPVTVQVLVPSAINTIAIHDDYSNTYGTVPASGNVLTNDADPEGNTLTTTPQTITNTQGTFTLQANGSYTFIPTTGATGATSFTYTVCDNGTPQACGTATLHILVDKAPDYATSVYMDQTTFTHTDTLKDFIVSVSNVNATYNKGPVQFFIAQESPNMTIRIDSTATSSSVFGGYPVSNPKWSVSRNGEYFILTLKQGQLFNPGTSYFVGFSVRVSAQAAPDQSFSLTPSVTPASGGDGNNTNNSSNINLLKN